MPLKNMSFMAVFFLCPFGSVIQCTLALGPVVSSGQNTSLSDSQ